jgi:hypothetical protein
MSNDITDEDLKAIDAVIKEAHKRVLSNGWKIVDCLYVTDKTFQLWDGDWKPNKKLTLSEVLDTEISVKLYQSGWKRLFTRTVYDYPLHREEEIWLRIVHPKSKKIYNWDDATYILESHNGDDDNIPEENLSGFSHQVNTILLTEDYGKTWGPDWLVELCFGGTKGETAKYYKIKSSIPTTLAMREEWKKKNNNENNMPV